MKEPLFNTVSNFAYIPAGVGVVVVCFAMPWISFGTAAGLLMLSIGSATFHFQRKPDGTQGRLGVLGWLGGHADELGMYWTFTGLLLLGVVHQGWIQDLHAASILIGQVIIYGMLIRHLSSTVVLGILAVPILVMLGMESWWELGMALLITVTAFAFRSGAPGIRGMIGLESTHGGYSSWKHGVWHILTAVLCLFIAYSFCT